MRDKDDHSWSASPVFRVFQLNKALIARVFRRYMIHQMDVADLTQETILRALEAEKRTAIREPLRFLVGIAKNVARNELERRSKNNRVLLDDFDPETHLSNDPPVDDVIEARRRLQVLGNAIAMLPPQAQKVFLLKHVYGASHREIADRFGIALSTVEKHVALGLRRCREAMIEDAAGESADCRSDDKSNVLSLNLRRRTGRADG